jgi:hypothetical protein
MWRRRRQVNTIPQKTNSNSIGDLMKTEGNKSTVANPSRMMIRMSNVLKEELKDMLSEELKKDLKEEFKTGA